MYSRQLRWSHTNIDNVGPPGLILRALTFCYQNAGSLSLTKISSTPHFIPVNCKARRAGILVETIVRSNPQGPEGRYFQIFCTVLSLFIMYNPHWPFALRQIYLRLPAVPGYTLFQRWSSVCGHLSLLFVRPALRGIFYL